MDSDLEFAVSKVADLPDEGRAYVEHVTTPDPLRERSGGSQTSSELAVVFPSSSSLNGHPGRPGKRATGGGGRPGARGPGRGPTVVWAQPGCWGFLTPKSRTKVLVGAPSVTLC